MQKLFCTSIVVFIEPGTGQLVVGSVFATFFTVLSVYVKPFRYQAGVFADAGAASDHLELHQLQLVYCYCYCNSNSNSNPKSNSD